MVKEMTVKRRRASSPATTPVSPQNVHACRTFVHVSKATFNSRYEQILDMWTRLDNSTPILVSKDSILKYSSDSLKYHRFFLDKEIITIREMNLGHKKGNNSEIYAIDIGGVEQPVILKKFVPDGDDNVEPEIEAELQKWAWRHGFAPAVKAYNQWAMIIEKCQEIKKMAVTKILEAGALPIILGGDHSIPIPVFRAYEGHGPITLIQIDAHIDW